MAVSGEIGINILLENSGLDSQSWQCGSPDLLNYDQMIKSVVELFPSTKDKALELFWKDEDEDLVTVSSDEELQQAFSDASNIGHVQFVVRASVIRPQPVICHGCKRSSQDHHQHYRCTRCPDHVLCHQCKASNLHSHHPMVRLNTATQKQHLEFSPNGVDSESTYSVTNTPNKDNDPATRTLPDPEQGGATSSDPADGSATTVVQKQLTRMQRTRKRRIQGMVEQCRRGVQQLDIKRATRNTSQTNGPFYNPAVTPRAGGEEDDDDDEELDRCEAKMEEWLKQNWDLDNSPNAEPPWKQMMRQLAFYWHGDKKPPFKK